MFGAVEQNVNAYLEIRVRIQCFVNRLVQID